MGEHTFCNNLLYEKISLKIIKNEYNDIHLLSKSLQYLLCQLPSSIFGDYHFEDFLEKIDAMNVKKILNDSESDDDVKEMSKNELMSLKTMIAQRYTANDLENKQLHRFGLISLILHLLKQISSQNGMSCHLMAQLFAKCFQSKQYHSLSNHSHFAIKVLIFHSYFLFPAKEWTMKEIVVAEKKEAKTLEKYQEIKLTKNEKQKQLKKKTKEPLTKYFDAEYKINNLKRFDIPQFGDEDQKFADNEYKEGVVDKEQQINLPKVDRQRSFDDLDVGTYEQKEHNVAIGTSVKKGHFEAIHTKKYERKKTESMSLSKHAKHGSFGHDDVNLKYANVGKIKESKPQSIKDLGNKNKAVKSKEILQKNENISEHKIIKNKHLEKKSKEIKYKQSREKIQNQAQNIAKQRAKKKHKNIKRKQVKNANAELYNAPMKIRNIQPKEWSEEQKSEYPLTPMNTINPEHFRNYYVQTNDNINVNSGYYQDRNDQQYEQIDNANFGCNVMYDWISKMCGTGHGTQYDRVYDNNYYNDQY